MRIRKQELPNYHCIICDTFCVSLSNLNTHLNTNRHKRSEELFKKNEPIRLKHKLSNEFIIDL